VPNPILSCPILRFQRGRYLFRGSEVYVGGTREDGAETTRPEDEIADEGAEAEDDGGQATG
jgi:hypothetical protein